MPVFCYSPFAVFIVQKYLYTIDMENQTKLTEAVCCPPFDPSMYDGKTVVWDKKLFVRKDLPTFLHMPLPGTIGSMMTKTWKQIEDAGAKPEDKDFLCLTFDPSPWKSENYLSVTKEIPGAQNTTLSGTFMAKVFDGPYRDVPKWLKEMEKLPLEEGKKIGKQYLCYTTCPKCAKKYGHNYVVVFAEII
jgi:hypothetical protein